MLVVDDDPIILQVTARLLRDLGLHGALVKSGEKALQLLEKQRFDVVLLDVSMHGLSGQDTLAEIRRAHSGALLPVLMVSGYSDTSTQEHFLKLGAQGYLTKPLDRAELAAALGRLTKR